MTVGHIGWGDMVRAMERVDMPEQDLLQYARAYVNGSLTELALHQWLCTRPGPITDQIEADLWSATYETDVGLTTSDEARQEIKQALAERGLLALTSVSSPNV